MKSGIIVMSELTGEIADRIRLIQERYDPRMAAELPPHITLTGSSGMGPIPARTPVAELARALEPVAAATAPFTVRFQLPMRFMQTTVVVLPVDPHGPIRALHEGIKRSGLPFEKPRFTFTPHCTLSFYPELTKAQYQALLAQRIEAEVLVDRIDVYRAETATRTRRVLELLLSGPATAAS